MQCLKTARTLELNENDLKRIAGGMTIDLRPAPTYPTTVSTTTSGGTSTSSGGSTGDTPTRLETTTPK